MYINVFTNSSQLEFGSYADLKLKYVHVYVGLVF